MARLKKTGIYYFPLDVYMDDRVRLIEAEFGLQGFAVLIKLWQKIYAGGGYYCEWNKDNALLFCKDEGIEFSQLNAIVNAATEREIFDMDLYKKYQILTSADIQNQYLEITSRRYKVDLDERYLLIKIPENIQNVYIGGVNVNNEALNVNNGTQSKVKKNKENKTKANDSKEKNPSQSASQTALPKGRAKSVVAACNNSGLFKDGVPPVVIDSINKYINKGAEPDMLCAVVNDAVKQGAKSWRYVETILDSKLRDGITTLDKYREAEQRFRDKKPSDSTPFSNFADNNEYDYDALEEKLMDMMLGDS